MTTTPKAFSSFVSFHNSIRNLISQLIQARRELPAEDQWKRFEVGLQLLLHHLVGAGDNCASEGHAIVESWYKTWVRVRRHIDLQVGLYVIQGPVKERLDACRDVWLRLGKVFGYDDVEADEKHQCMYPRCANPCPDGGARLVCARCCWVHYCSVECQTA